MIRCPYIHEMHERLIGPTPRRPLPPVTFPPLAKPETMDRESDCLLESPRPESRQIGTMVKLNPDGFGSHTTPTHHHHHRPAHHHQQQHHHQRHKSPAVPCNGLDDEDEVLHRRGHRGRRTCDDDSDDIDDDDDDGIHLRAHLSKIVEGRKPKNAK
uniref:Uncharacterized protein n=2 Tax=Anopheles albimanus TaxID=7167 RepID=A0A182FIF7_ANOAL